MTEKHKAKSKAVSKPKAKVKAKAKATKSPMSVAHRSRNKLVRVPISARIDPKLRAQLLKMAKSGEHKGNLSSVMESVLRKAFAA